MFEKLIKKGTHMFTRDHRGKKSKNPLASIDIRSQIEPLKFNIQFW